MEPMSGLELLRQVRADPDLKTLPFIMITAENRKERVAKAEQAGANGYIVKPFNAETLSEPDRARDGRLRRRCRAPGSPSVSVRCSRTGRVNTNHVDDQGEMDEGGEHDVELLEAREDAAEAFEPAEQALDLVAPA